MQVFSSVAQAVTSGRFKQSAVCLGNFDGVHLGQDDGNLLAARAILGSIQSFGNSTIRTAR